MLEHPKPTSTKTTRIMKNCPCSSQLRYSDIKTLKISLLPVNWRKNNVKKETSSTKEIYVAIFLNILFEIEALTPHPIPKLTIDSLLIRTARGYDIISRSQRVYISSG